MKAIYSLFFAVSTLWAIDARACTCGENVMFEQALADADLVVLAELKSVKDHGVGAPIDSQLEGTFELTEAFKGIVAPEFKVSTAANSAACGMAFNKKQPYMFILKGTNRWRVDSCDHGGPIPKDIVHFLVHEVQDVLKDPKAAIAKVKADEEKEVWLKQQGPALFALEAKLKKCGQDFAIDKAAQQKRLDTVQKGRTLWLQLMGGRLDNPKMISMLGNVLNKQANKLLEDDIASGQFNKVICDALLLDGGVEQSYRKMQAFQ